MNSEILDKHIFQMTGREFIETIRTAISKEDKQEIEWVYGMRGIAKLFNCGLTKAQEIKNSGIIDAAIMNSGKQMKIDSKKAIELYFISKK